MRKIIVSISFIIFISCAASSERMRADGFYRKGDYIKDLRSFEMALRQSNADHQRNEIRQKIELTKDKIVDNTLRQAELAYTQIDPPSLKVVTDTISVLESSPTDDRLGRIAAQIGKCQTVKKAILKNKAESLIAEGEYFNALGMYRKAQAINPEDKMLIEEIDRLTAFMEREKKLGVAEIEKLLKKGKRSIC